MAKKKEIVKNDNKKLIIGVVIVVIIAILLVLLLTNIFKKDNKKTDDKKEPETKYVSDEKTIEHDYGFTKEDAINIIKKQYNSDSYVFEARANVDNTYIVIVSNPDIDKVIKYQVDPNDGSFKIISD